MSKQAWEQTLVSAQSSGATLTAAAAATCLPTAARITLPNNYFDTIGQQLLITATGTVSTVITTPGTLRFDVRMGPSGTIVVFDSLAMLPDTVAAHTNVGWWLDILLTLRSVGSGTSAQFWGQGKFTCEDLLGVPATAPKGVLTAMLPWNSAPALGTGFDSTAANVIDMFFTQTVTTGSMTLNQYSVVSKN